MEVGNIDSDNAIEVSVSPAKAYVGDTAEPFTVTIKALGPIHDVDTAEDKNGTFDTQADTDYDVQIVVE